MVSDCVLDALDTRRRDSSEHIDAEEDGTTAVIVKKIDPSTKALCKMKVGESIGIRSARYGAHLGDFAYEWLIHKSIKASHRKRSMVGCQVDLSFIFIPHLMSWLGNSLFNKLR
jgi:hypothetical protein